MIKKVIDWLKKHFTIKVTKEEVGEKKNIRWLFGLRFKLK